MNYDLKIMPKTDNKIFEERETGLTHSPFQLELKVFEAIKNGNQQALKKAISNYFKNGFVIGKMSDDYIQEIRYWAVSTIGIATHYAILGGLDETDAYNLSDEFINTIDKLNSFEKCVKYLSEKAVFLTQKVNKNHHYTSAIRKCVHYINIHLHEKIKIDDLANYTNLSKDYLSVLFKKETSESIHEYILNRKLEASKQMISEGLSLQEISYILCFCSQTHFTNCFKKKFNQTPFEYKQTL